MDPCFAHVLPALQNCRYKPKINEIGQNLDLCYDILLYSVSVKSWRGFNILYF